jgi:hypothetical protein
LFISDKREAQKKSRKSRAAGFAVSYRLRGSASDLCAFAPLGSLRLNLKATWGAVIFR